MTTLESKCWELNDQPGSQTDCQHECCAPESCVGEDLDDISRIPVKTVEEVREQFLNEVGSMINENPLKKFGHKGDVYIIRSLWMDFCGREFTLRQVAAMLALVELARLKLDPANTDIWKDLAAHAALGGTL